MGNMASKFFGAWAVAAGCFLALIFAAQPGLAQNPQPGLAQNPAALETTSLPRGEDQNPEAALPRVLNEADAALYREIFTLQKAGKWRAADQRIAMLRDTLLIGHVLFQRYMHPTAYRSKYTELKGWMAQYADHPGAARIYRLALRRQPKRWRAPRRPQNASFGQESIAGPRAAARAGPRLSRAHRRQVRRLTNRVKSLVRRERPTQALAILDNKANRHFLGTLYFDRALAIIARGYYHAGENEKVLAAATRAIERSGAQAPYAYWWAGLAAWRLEKHGVAAAHFAAMAQAPELTDWPRAAAAFWAARAALVGGEPAKVTPMLRLGARYPYTFYGMLAMQALDKPPPFDWALPRLGAVETELLQHIPAAKRALALIEAGQTVRAESELKRLTGAPSPALSRVLLALIGKANLPDVALRLGFRLQSKRGERHDAALFPVPGWIPEGGYSIDKALIFAFMRQESRFKTKAKSRRGASGLMQLMPATARFIATKQERRRGRRALFEPEFNIALGQKYIQKMLDEPTIGGNLFYAVTAYNAGPGTLRKWRRQVNYRDDPLLFIESIRSRETRDYVERVLTNFWTYRRRFDQDVPSLAAVAAGAWPVYIPLDPPPPTAKAN